MAAGPTVAVYLITPGQWLAHDDAACKVDFWLRNLVELAGRLQALNVPLLIRDVEDWQAAPDALLKLCQSWPCSACTTTTNTASTSSAVTMPLPPGCGPPASTCAAISTSCCSRW